MPGEEFWEEVLDEYNRGHGTTDIEKEGTYYICETFAAVYVKEGEFFKSQGGLTDDWGQWWRPVHAKSCEHARSMGRIKTLEEYENERRIGNKRYGKEN